MDRIYTEISIKHYCLRTEKSEKYLEINTQFQHMEPYPLLREEVDRIVSEYVRSNENRCKEHVRFLLDFELAYINTNHEVSFQRIYYQ